MSDYIQDVDGYWYWEPVEAGYWSARVLREKADKLDELNRNWDEIVQREVDGSMPQKGHDELCPKASGTLYDEEYHPDCTCGADTEDGFGNAWHRCARPDCDLCVVRPGKVQCSGYCEGAESTPQKGVDHE